MCALPGKPIHIGRFEKWLRFHEAHRIKTLVIDKDEDDISFPGAGGPGGCMGDGEPSADTALPKVAPRELSKNVRRSIVSGAPPILVGSAWLRESLPIRMLHVSDASKSHVGSCAVRSVRCSGGYAIAIAIRAVAQIGATLDDFG